MSEDTKEKPRFTSTDVIRNENGRPIAPQPSKKHMDKMADQTDEPKEVGGRDGPSPTRFGDWEKNGRCFDF